MITIIVSSSFPFGCSIQGSPQCLHLSLSSVSSSLTPTNFISSFTTPINLLFGLPQGLLPGGSNLSILLPIYSLSIVCTCPNHLSLASLTVSTKHLTCTVPLMIHSDNSQREPLHFYLCYLQLFLLSFPQCL